jgi:phage recombination protein Bet
VQTPENIELLKKSLVDQKTVLTDSELGIFLYQAQKTGLDPLARQIYVMKRDQGGVSFMTSIDGQRLVAQRTHEYDGQTPPQWCGPDGKWVEVWLSENNPSAARIGVYRKGMREPVYAVATWKSYCKMKDEWVNNKKTGKKVPSGVWGQMGDVMLAKCAEALALRKAFPQELSGLYTPEEMDQASADAPEPPRVMTASDALAEAGKVLVEKGFSRDEALTIMAGIADVDDPSKLNGNSLGPVLEIVKREDAEALALYIPTDQDDEASDSIPEGEVATAPATPVEPPKEEAPTPPLYEVPDYKKGSSSLARPEMVKLFNKWTVEYGLTKKADLERFCQNAIGKPGPQTFDDYKLALEVLADELSTQAKQGALV